MSTKRPTPLVRHLPWISALVAAGVTYAVTVLAASRFELTPLDDAFISARYALNWASGYGLCFNPPERVEGYTNFLLVALEAAAIRAGLDPLEFAVAVGRASLACLAGLVALFSAKRVFRRRHLLATAAGVLLASNPVLVCWANSALESCLYALLLLQSAMLLLNARTWGRVACSAMLLVLASMTRPEAVALAPVMILLARRRCRPTRAAIVYTAILGVGFLTYWALRGLYFSDPFPNTFYAKLDYGNMSLLKRGLHYLADAACAAPLLTILVLIALPIMRGAPRWVRGFLLIAAVQALVIVYEGGDHFAMFRFMVPVLPFVSLVALYPCSYALKRFRASHVLAGAATLVALGAIASSSLIVWKQTVRQEEQKVTHLKQFTSECRHARDWASIGRRLRQDAAKGESVCTVAIGALGYYSGMTVIDPHGIIDRRIAKKRTRLGTGYPGHEKYDVDYVLSRRPGYILLVHVLTPRPVAERALNLMVWGQFNRDLLDHPSLREEYRYEVIEIGGRYLNLFVRRDLPPISTGDNQESSTDDP
ncbi:MAG: hypothetical protein JSU63_16705 [Phycisphaerales bacterium]|nr:MAG: hypothetical protein JSU63_16705 [Phycisphaerales bacterium]